MWWKKSKVHYFLLILTSRNFCFFLALHFISHACMHAHACINTCEPTWMYTYRLMCIHTCEGVFIHGSTCVLLCMWNPEIVFPVTLHAQYTRSLCSPQNLLDGPWSLQWMGDLIFVTKVFCSRERLKIIYLPWQKWGSSLCILNQDSLKCLPLLETVITSF